jgi:hypothetical protein
VAGGSGLNSYAVNLTFGRLALAAADQALDGGLGGLRTAGGFSKLNLEFQRSQFFDAPTAFTSRRRPSSPRKTSAPPKKWCWAGPTACAATRWAKAWATPVSC